MSDRPHVLLHEVWARLSARTGEPAADELLQRFVEAFAAWNKAVRSRNDVFRRYLGEDYDSLIYDVEALGAERVARLAADYMMDGNADEQMTRADAAAVADAWDKLVELENAVAEAYERLFDICDESVAVLERQGRQ